jgi:hypothetical protein
VIGERTSFRQRLPDLLIEALFIFLAVLLALAAEEWREGRDRRELADRALRSVVEEIRSNLEELERTTPKNEERLERARRVLDELEAGGEEGDADIGLEVSLLSTAAWQSAQMSQAVQYLDLETMREISEVYEIQELYERMQDDMVDGIRELVRIAEEDPRAAVRQGTSGLAMVMELQRVLADVYRNSLEELEAGSKADPALTDAPD